MIYVKNLRQASVDKNVWAIVRSLKNPGRMTQVADLSPSKRLFWDYLSWKKAGNWNAEKFMNSYAPRFMSELKANLKAIQLLKDLTRRDPGDDVTLVCFCDDEALCHRSIIAGILQGAGASISAGSDYSRYYEQFDIAL